MITTAAILVHIIDRTHDGVAEISKTKVAGPDGKFTNAWTSQYELAVFTIDKSKNDGPSCYAADHKITPAEWDRLDGEKSLREMKLKRCDFGSEQLKRLERIHVKRMHFIEISVDEKLMKSISKIEGLSELQFFDCDFSPHVLAPLVTSSVSYLGIRHCFILPGDKALDKSDFQPLKDMPRLQGLELEETRFVPASLMELEHTNIRSLNCRNCNLTDAEMNYLARIPSLNQLIILRNSRITCEGLRTLLKAKQIEHILVDWKGMHCSFSEADEQRFNRSG